MKSILSFHLYMDFRNQTQVFRVTLWVARHFTYGTILLASSHIFLKVSSLQCFLGKRPESRLWPIHVTQVGGLKTSFRGRVKIQGAYSLGENVCAFQQMTSTSGEKQKIFYMDLQLLHSCMGKHTHRQTHAQAPPPHTYIIKEMLQQSCRQMSSQSCPFLCSG